MATIEIPDSALTVVAAPPECISQRNVETTLGIHRRAYLESLPAFKASGGKVLHVGRLRLVHRAAFVAWLERRAEPMPGNGEGDDDVQAMADATGLRLIKG